MNGSMKTSLLAVMLIMCATVAKADTADFTYTNLVTGDVWTWAIPQQQTPDVYGVQFGTDVAAYFNVQATMNGILSLLPYSVIFSADEMTFECTDFNSCAWDRTAPGAMRGTLFSGPTSNPTFITGTFAGQMMDSGGEKWDAASLVVTDPVPEPSTFAMLFAGLLFVGISSRRRHAD